MVDNVKLVQNMLGITGWTHQSEALKEGNVVMFYYRAKNLNQRFDLTPMIVILRVTDRHILGINFHWCPIPMRKILMSYIIKLNKINIKFNRPLVLHWHQVKPFLRLTGFYPILHLYIKRNIYPNLIRIPYNYLVEAVQIPGETFTGRHEQELYERAVLASKHYGITKLKLEPR